MIIKYELRPYIILIFILLASNIKAQTNQSYYMKAYTKIDSMLLGKDSFDFKKAVYVAENAYLER